MTRNCETLPDKKVNYDQIFLRAAEWGCLDSDCSLGCLGKYAENVIKQFGIVPSFLEPRISDEVRLSEQGGLIVANHPGSSDIPILLSGMKEAGMFDERLQILVSSRSMDMYAKYFGEDHFIEANNYPRQMLERFERIKDHVGNGGYLLMFPGGYKAGAQPDTFNTGLAYLIEAIGSEAWIWSMAIDAEYQNKISENVVQRVENTMKLKSPEDLKGFVNDPQVEVAVDSWILPLDHWRVVVDCNLPRKANSDRLLEHFFELHNLKRSEL